MPYIKLTEQEKESANAVSLVDYLTAHGESVKAVSGTVNMNWLAVER